MEIDAEYSGEYSIKDFDIESEFGTDLYFIFTVNNKIKHKMPMKYEENSQTLSIVLASDPNFELEGER